MMMSFSSLLKTAIVMAPVLLKYHSPVTSTCVDLIGLSMGLPSDEPDAVTDLTTPVFCSICTACFSFDVACMSPVPGRDRPLASAKRNCKSG
jgi:hypothetical protein